MDVNAVQFWNAKSLIVVTELEKVTDARFVHSLNMLSPTIGLAMSAEVRPVQS